MKKTVPNHVSRWEEGREGCRLRSYIIQIYTRTMKEKVGRRGRVHLRTAGHIPRRGRNIPAVHELPPWWVQVTWRAVTWASQFKHTKEMGLRSGLWTQGRPERCLWPPGPRRFPGARSTAVWCPVESQQSAHPGHLPVSSQNICIR